ncbi:hypothetical protein NG800_018200 [Epilithonimonas ginsengisoli]|uniref:Uncharacterized protein n=1 Tax=Epilithonimonas ginsengisoli TaxID=1245592 RepID=A0ABU4JMI4_9FLAO|nr:MULTISPECIES: hypothetical protein [Chryseobacterium group]MBV6881822.1 hypothetical protein [Epilithonimonas sp. FP105]MDW8550865.1 hypothetical protein [Epilithonimonas ginsengisoli]
MTTKILVFGLLLILSSFSESQAQKNPDYICKDCGSFDLAKMTFKEKFLIKGPEQIYGPEKVYTKNE